MGFVSKAEAVNKKGEVKKGFIEGTNKKGHKYYLADPKTKTKKKVESKKSSEVKTKSKDKPQEKPELELFKD